MARIIEAKGQDWHIVTEKPAGGFCFIYEQVVFRAWLALQDGRIGLRDFRVWLACHELKARRCVAGGSRTPHYTFEELHRLVGGTGGEHVRRSVKTLVREHLITFTEKAIDLTPGLERGSRGRLIPMPRPLLRHLCRVKGRAYLATGLGHVLRCLFYRKGQCRSGGWCKSSWVAEKFGVALRAVKEARQKLVNLGVLVLAKADQLRLNRFGRPVLVSMDWGVNPHPGTRNPQPDPHLLGNTRNSPTGDLNTRNPPDRRTRLVLAHERRNRI